MSIVPSHALSFEWTVVADVDCACECSGLDNALCAIACSILRMGCCGRCLLCLRTQGLFIVRLITLSRGMMFALGDLHMRRCPLCLSELHFLRMLLFQYYPGLWILFGFDYLFSSAELKMLGWSAIPRTGVVLKYQSLGVCRLWLNLVRKILLQVLYLRAFVI